MDSLADSSLVQWLASLGWIDRVALGLVVIAVLRGLWIGLLREAFSVAAIAAAFIAVRLWTDPVALWLLEKMPLDYTFSERTARIAGGVVVALGALLVVVAIGGFVTKRIRAGGLGLLDRLFGGALGAAEGALLAGVALIGLMTVVGPDHEVLRGSRGVELLEQARARAHGVLPDVAAPPPRAEPSPRPPANEPTAVESEADEVSV